MPIFRKPEDAEGMTTYRCSREREDLETESSSGVAITANSPTHCAQIWCSAYMTDQFDRESELFMKAPDGTLYHCSLEAVSIEWQPAEEPEEW